MDEPTWEEIPTSRMCKTSIAVILFSLVGIAAACSASKEEGKIRPEPGPVNPDEARIAATVVEIDSLRSRRAGDPCASHPCYATIMVDSVLDYGSAFLRPLVAGEHLRVRFAFTLSPTEEAMPELDDAYPGLSAGDAFRADLRARAAPVDTTSFVIYAYRVK